MTQPVRSPIIVTDALKIVFSNLSFRDQILVSKVSRYWNGIIRELQFEYGQALALRAVSIPPQNLPIDPTKLRRGLFSLFARKGDRFLISDWDRERKHYSLENLRIWNSKTFETLRLDPADCKSSPYFHQAFWLKNDLFISYEEAGDKLARPIFWKISKKITCIARREIRSFDDTVSEILRSNQKPIQIFFKGERYYFVSSNLEVFELSKENIKAYVTGSAWSVKQTDKRYSKRTKTIAYSFDISKQNGESAYSFDTSFKDCSASFESGWSWVDRNFLLIYAGQELQILHLSHKGALLTSIVLMNSIVLSPLYISDTGQLHEFATCPIRDVYIENGKIRIIYLDNTNTLQVHEVALKVPENVPLSPWKKRWLRVKLFCRWLISLLVHLWAWAKGLL